MSWTPEELEALDRRIISGHPTQDIGNGTPIVIYVCANCERARRVLFLSKDRWLCTHCRNEGSERPSFVPLTRKD